MRAYQRYLGFGAIWSLTAVVQAGLHSFDIGIASFVGVGAFVVGVVSARSTLKQLEKSGGEYRPSMERTLFGVGLGLAFAALLFYLLFFEAPSLATILQFNSVYVAIPAFFFGGAVGYGSWEVPNCKEIHWEGRTSYSVPRGLSWQEQYQFRMNQRNRVKTGNSGEQDSTGKV